MKSIPELFREQAEQTPDTIAILFRDTAMTYRDLSHRADEVARRLRALGVGPDVKVALYLERSIELVVAMLGVLTAGGAYVPLDPLHPRQRLAYIIGRRRTAGHDHPDAVAGRERRRTTRRSCWWTPAPLSRGSIRNRSRCVPVP